jgi:hypothetical protein
MWIHERYFAILRKRDTWPMPCWRLLPALALLVSATGCVVTDKIEFEEPFNYPFSIIDRYPEEPLIPGDRDTTLRFDVTVWDPDFEEVEDVPLWGWLVVQSEQGTFGKGCPSRVTTVEEREALDDTRITHRVECVSPLLSTFDAGTIVEVTLVVSDLGFNRNNEPRSGANVAEVVWLVEMQGE